VYQTNPRFAIMDASVVPSSSLNLMDQVMEMMELALAIYGLGVDVLALPMTAKEIGAIYSDHYETIQKLHWDGASFMELYSTAAPRLQGLAEQRKNCLRPKPTPQPSLIRMQQHPPLRLLSRRQ
jgi:hypothetical protein